VHLACRLLLAGAAGVLPLARLVELAQVLSALLQTWGNQAMSWMAAALALLPDQVVSQADKQQLLGEWFLVRVSEWFLVRVSEWFLVKVSEWFLVRVSEWFLVRVSEWFLVRVSEWFLVRVSEWCLVRVTEWFLVRVSEWFLVRVSRSGQPGGQAAAAGRVVSGEGQQASLKVPCVLML